MNKTSNKVLKLFISILNGIDVFQYFKESQDVQVEDNSSSEQQSYEIEDEQEIEGREDMDQFIN